jgi:hypothetical protein
MSDTPNSYWSDFATRSDSWTEDQFVHRNNSVSGTTMKLPSILGWYRILRAQHQLPVFQAIRGALWLAS